MGGYGPSGPKGKGALLSIVLGEPRTVVVGCKEKHIIPHPRDQIKAFRLLQDIARNGCLPETETSVDDLVWLDVPPPEKEEADLDFLLEVAGPTDSTGVTTTRPDGEKIKAAVDAPRKATPRRN